MQRSAHIEAERHLRKGLELLAPLPQTASRLQREIALQNALGVCLMPTRGFGNPEVAAAFARGAELAERGDDAHGLFVSLRGRGQYNFISGDLRTGRDDTHRVMALAERMGDHDCLGQLGYAARAEALANDTLALAEALAHPFSMAIALWQVGGLNVTLRQHDRVRTVGERMIGYSREMGLWPMIPVGRTFRGEALTHQGETIEGIAELREGMAKLRGMGSLLTMPFMMTGLADALGRSGRTDEGLAVVDEVLKMVDAGGERFGLPDFHRVKGNLLVDRSAADRDAAVAAYRRAIEIAREQEARLLELRAATSLARLWGENGKRDAARELLAPVYQWFTEGFDKPDLRDAKALLDALA